MRKDCRISVVLKVSRLCLICVCEIVCASLVYCIHACDVALLSQTVMYLSSCDCTSFCLFCFFSLHDDLELL